MRSIEASPTLHDVVLATVSLESLLEAFFYRILLIRPLVFRAELCN